MITEVCHRGLRNGSLLNFMISVIFVNCTTVECNI